VFLLFQESGKQLDHEFQIERGKIKFSDPSEPTVHLKAHTEFDETRIDMNATGNLKKLEISFSSTPPLTQSEILSLLILGHSPKENSHLSTEDLMMKATSILLYSVDFYRELENITGLQIRLKEPILEQNSTAPQVVISKKINPNLALTWTSPLNNINQFNQLNLEYQASDTVSVSGIVNKAVENQSHTVSYGVDLKLKKQFN